MLGPEARRCCNCDRSVADLLSHLVTREGRKEGGSKGYRYDMRLQWWIRRYLDRKRLRERGEGGEP